MPEQLDLTTAYSVRELNLNRDQDASITVRLRNLATGEQFAHRYEGAVAATLIIQLNKADLTVQSLERRILLRLVADGLLTGTVSGAPD